MTQYLGPIPIPASQGPVQAAQSGPASSRSDRLWQRLTYIAATMMTASLAFIVLAVGDDISSLAQESYFFFLRSIGVVTSLGGI